MAKTEVFRNIHQSLEDWKTQHRAAMECLDLEDALDAGMYLFGIIESIAARAGETAAHAGHDETLARAVAALYREWFDAAKSLMHELQAKRVDGFDVKHAAEFERAFHAAIAPAAFDAAKLSDAEASIERGGGRTLENAE